MFVPIIDFTPFYHGTKFEQAQVAARVTQEFQKNGAVRLPNQEIPVEMINECYQWNEKFFKLPMEEKEAISNERNVVPLFKRQTGSPKDTFTLTSPRLACLDTNGVETSNANGCTVLFVGNKRSGAASVTYEYEYPNQNTNPGPGVPLATFGTVTFPKDFKGLTEVFISLTSVQNDVVGVDPLLDDVCLSIQG